MTALEFKSISDNKVKSTPLQQAHVEKSSKNRRKNVEVRTGNESSEARAQPVCCGLHNRSPCIIKKSMYIAFVLEIVLLSL
jgi:hypothetical protein